MPLAFTLNAGQIDSKVNYYVKGGSFGFYFTTEEVVLTFIQRTSNIDSFEDFTRDSSSKIDTSQDIGVTLALQFIGANPNVKIEGECKCRGKVNYFKGNDPSKWYTELPTYEKLIYRDLWPGIDLVFYGAMGQLKYEFIVHPGSSVQDIKLNYRGSDGIVLDEEGNLIINNQLGILIDEKPISYQKIQDRKVMIDSRFVVTEQEYGENIYGFEIEENYHSDYSIVIDPGLVYSTYLGGSSSDEGFDISVDDAGSTYVTGETYSNDFPTTPGAFQTSSDRYDDVFVTKLTPDGSGLVYSTYLGGSSSDYGRGIVIDNAGSAYVTGMTGSNNFPTTAGAFQTSLAGDGDVFVTKLTPDGSGLVYSTYLGGRSREIGLGITVDSAGSTYITGWTYSNDFPTTPGAFQTSLAGPDDVFVTKLTPDGSSLVYSTYLGGINYDEGRGIAVDNAGSAYVTGYTSSNDFPTTTGVFQTSLAGDADAFVAKLTPDGSGLVYSTYLGGSSSDDGRGIALDNAGNAYVTGVTSSNDFPITTGAFQTSLAGSSDAFVTKLTPDGSGLVYSTYLGGSSSDDGRGIAVDNAGSAYVTGVTSSNDFPTTTGAFQTSLAGDADAFVAKLTPDGLGLVYSTYLGGSSWDYGYGIAVDNAGNAYVTGYTFSDDFPTTTGAFQTSRAGSYDVFVTKIDTKPTRKPSRGIPFIDFKEIL